MNFVNVRELRNQSSALLDKLPDEQEMVITRNGTPVAILSSIDENNLEYSLSLMRRMKTIAAVESMQQASAKSGLTMSMEEIDAEIALARKERVG